MPLPAGIGRTSPAYRGRVSVSVVEHLKAAFRPTDLPSRRRPAAKVAIVQLITYGAFTLFGHFDLALLASLGMFAILYAPSAAYKRRLVIVSSLALAMVVCVLLGILAGSSPVAVLVMVILVATLSAFLCNALLVGPPAAYFIMLGCGVVNYMIYVHDVPAVQVLVMTIVGGAAAVIGTMAELVLDPHGPERKAVTAAIAATRAYVESKPGEDSRPLHRRGASALHRARTELGDAAPLFPTAPWSARRRRRVAELEAQLDEAEVAFGARVGLAAEHYFSGGELDEDFAAELSERFEGSARAISGRPSVPNLLRQSLAWPSDQLITAFRVAVATTIAGVVTLAIGGEHIYWSTAFAAVALHQGGARVVQSYRAANRLVGTVIGVFVFALIVLLAPPEPAMLFVLVGLQFLIELFVAKQYALATLFITPLALLISVGGKLPPSPVPIMSERLLDTVIGVIASIIAIWAFGRSLPRVVLHAQTARTLRSTSNYLGSPGPGEARERLVLDARELETVAGAVITESGATDDVRNAQEIVHVAYVLMGTEAWDDASWDPEGIAGVTANIDAAAREIREDSDAATRRIGGLVGELSSAVRRNG